jgi:hypothetical protein
MSVNAALAQAARRVRAANKRLPRGCRLDIVTDWQALLDEVKQRSDARAISLIDEWTQEIESRIAQRLLHAPLEAPR